MDNQHATRKVKISIVVPVYNIKKEYLRQCMESLIGQTYKGIEVILVDDGSTNGAENWCDEFAYGDTRVKTIHHTKNQGLPSARNTGMRHVSEEAEWLMFVDADDWIEKDTCEKLVKRICRWEIEGKKMDIILYSGFRDYPSKSIKSEYAYSDEKMFSTREARTLLQIESMKRICRGNHANSLNMDSACWRLFSVDFLKQNHLFFEDVSFREDGLFFLNTTEKASAIVFIQENFYHYRSTSGSMVNSYRPNADTEHLMYLRCVKRFIDSNQKEDLSNAFYHTVLLSMEMCICQKFFNRENIRTTIEKQRECERYFQMEPYASVFRKIDISQLSRNHKIKAILIKNKHYAAMMNLRTVFLLINRQQEF